MFKHANTHTYAHARTRMHTHAHAHTHTHTGPDEAQMMSTVIHRQDKDPLASFSVGASSWDHEVCLLVSERVCLHDNMLAVNYVILLILLHCCLMGCVFLSLSLSLFCGLVESHRWAPTALVINALGGAGEGKWNTHTHTHTHTHTEQLVCSHVHGCFLNALHWLKHIQISLCTCVHVDRVNEVGSVLIEAHV